MGPGGVLLVVTGSGCGSVFHVLGCSAFWSVSGSGLSSMLGDICVLLVVQELFTAQVF